MKIINHRLPVIILLLAICNAAITTAQSTPFPDPVAMDKSVKPGDNFYLYVNGTWQKDAKIPPAEVGVGSVFDVYNKAKEHIHSILTDLAKAQNPQGSYEQKIGGLFESGMDTATIEERGYVPVKPILAQISSLQNAHDIMQFVAQQATQGNELLIGFGIVPDLRNSTINIAIFGQGGLGLPDKDYYFRTDPATLSVVNAYQTYITNVFMIMGDDSATAVKKMLAVYDLEKQLATSHRSKVELRDPQSNYNKMLVADLDKEMPSIEWKKTLATLGIQVDSINLAQPAFYKKTDSLLTTIPISTWQYYLSFHTLEGYAPYLSTPFVNARFNYFKKLYGQKQLRPRWERVGHIVDDELGYALGKIYVEKYFTPEAKQKMITLVNNLQKAFEIRINKNDWMSDSTKKIAVDKLHAIIKKIGYPDVWRDYSNVVIEKGKFFENLISCEKNAYQFNLNKLGKPVDKTEWLMTPPTVNAYYNPPFNEVVFPAGYLQVPFFDPNAGDAINYGAIGSTIGHEMTHGFDDQGAQYDKNGNLKNWWSHEDSVKFVAKTKLIINQFNQFIVVDSVHVNGELTTGENIADLGGLNIAYDAFKMTTEGRENKAVGGFTADQRFFLSYAVLRRVKLTEAFMRHLTNIDPHSPDMFRTIGPLANMDSFYKAFNIQPADKMYVPEKDRIVIW